MFNFNCTARSSNATEPGPSPRGGKTRGCTAYTDLGRDFRDPRAAKFAWRFRRRHRRHGRFVPQKRFCGSVSAHARSAAPQSTCNQFGTLQFYASYNASIGANGSQCPRQRVGGGKLMTCVTIDTLARGQAINSFRIVTCASGVYTQFFSSVDCTDAGDDAGQATASARSPGIDTRPCSGSPCQLYCLHF